MSVFSRIFIVINLGLTVLLVGVMATLLAQKADYRVKYGTTHEDYVADQADLKARSQGHAERIQALGGAVVSASERLARTRREAGDTTRQRADASRELNARRARRGQLHTDIRQLTKTSNGLDKQVSGLVDDRQVAARGRDRAVAAHRRARSELGRTTAHLSEVARGITDLQAQAIALTHSERRAREYLIAAHRQGLDVAAIAREQPISLTGQITATRPDVYLCLVSLGANDGLQPGMILRVQRGRDYVGLVKVRRVFANTASAQYLMEFMRRGQQPARRDEVTTDH